MVPVGVYLSNPSGETVFLNDRWCEITGFKREEGLGWGWVQSVHPDDRERMREQWQTSLDSGGSVFKAECRRVRPDGRVVWTAVAANALRDTDGTILGHVGTVMDVTELKGTQERLENAVREQEVAVSRERLLRRELDHRVGNNLSALLGLIRVCEDGPGSRGDLAQRLRMMVSAMGRAHKVISQAHGEPVCVRKFMEEMTRSLVESHPECGFGMEGPPVCVDKGRVNSLAMVVQELLTNSLKHGALGRRGGRIDVVWAEDGRERVRVEWREHGAGRIESVKPGTGLSIVKMLVEGDLGGTISVDAGADGVVCVLRARTGPNRSDEPKPGEANQ
jgi:PAS domain S-box-containing protein